MLFEKLNFRPEEVIFVDDSTKCYTEDMTAIDGLTEVNSIAAPIALNAWSAMSDFLIIIVMILVFVLFARYVGRGPFVGVLLAFYAAYAVYVAFPYTSYLPTAPATTALFAHLGLYIALVFIFYVVLRRVVVSDFLYVGSIGLIVLSFLGAAFLLALAYHVFPVSTIYHFTPPIDMLFSPDGYFFWWFVAPAIGLFFLAR